MASVSSHTQNSGRIIGRWKATGDPLRKPTMYDISKETERQQVARRKQQVPSIDNKIMTVCSNEA